MPRKADTQTNQLIFQNAVNRYGSEWLEKQVVFLGNESGVVVHPKISGMYWATQQNKKVISVFNAVNVQAAPDLQVLVGRKKSQPHRWQIIEERDAYLEPAGKGGVGYHAHQHMVDGGDRVPIDRKQIIPFTIQVYDAAGFIIAVNGGIARTATAIRKVPSELLDLSSYVITSGAKYVSVELGDDGILSLNDGTAFASVLTATDADIPVPASGKHHIGFVLLHESQTELSDADICVPMPLAVVPTASGVQISESDPDTPADGDLFGFWDIVDLALKHISWADLIVLLNVLYAEVGHTHTSSGSEIVMEDGVTFPPVPVTTEDGTDWIYSD